MTDIVTREMLATGEAFVTTLNDVQMVRDRAVAAEREACAQIAEHTAALDDPFLRRVGQAVAAKIRQRGAK